MTVALIKYTLVRLALFGAVFAVLLPLPMDRLVSAGIALMVSSVLGYVVLAKSRRDIAQRIATRGHLE